MDYALHLIAMLLIYSSLVVSLDLMIGHTGILSFAHASFYGIGAYVTAILTVYAGVNWFPAMILAFAIGGIIAGAIAVPTLKLGGDYFILALFGFTLIVTSLILNMEWLTNGPFGIRGVPRPSFFGYQVQSGFGMLSFIAVVVGFIFFVHWRFARSPMKSMLHAIRDDESVALSLGINVVRTRIVIFAMSGAFAALSGALAAFYFRFVTADSYGLETIILLWAMLFVGGNCSIAGCIVGPAVLVLFPEIFRFVGSKNLDIAHIQTGMYGLLLVLLMLFRPQGIAGGKSGIRT